jgi:hypothetical protein
MIGGEQTGASISGGGVERSRSGSEATAGGVSQEEFLMRDEMYRARVQVSGVSARTHIRHTSVHRIAQLYTFFTQMYKNVHRFTQIYTSSEVSDKAAHPHTLSLSLVD